MSLDNESNLFYVSNWNIKLFLLRLTFKSSYRERLFYSSSSSGRGSVRISPLGAVAKLEAPLSAADLFPRKRRFCVTQWRKDCMRRQRTTHAGKSLINNFFIAPKVSFTTDFGGLMIGFGICNVYEADVSQFPLMKLSTQSLPWCDNIFSEIPVCWRKFT